VAATVMPSNFAMGCDPAAVRMPLHARLTPPEAVRMNCLRDDGISILRAPLYVVPLGVLRGEYISLGKT
jgi:hypothetical protein